MGAIVGVPFVIWRSIVAQRQVDIAANGLVTDRINAAVASLGAEKLVKIDLLDSEGNICENGDGVPIIVERTKPNLAVRIGALYALQRIAQENLNFHLQVMRIISSYVRDKFPILDLEPSVERSSNMVARLDLQAAIEVLGTRNARQKNLETQKIYRIDLCKTNLSGANFYGLDFSGAVLAFCRIEGAILATTKLDGAKLNGSLFNFSNFKNARLVGADLSQCRITAPIPSTDGFILSINMADLTGSILLETQMPILTYLGDPAMISTTLGNWLTEVNSDVLEDLILTDRINGQYRNVINHAVLRTSNTYTSLVCAGKIPDLKVTEAFELASRFGVQNWLDYGLGDAATGWAIENHRKRNGHIYFPYTDVPDPKHTTD